MLWDYACVETVISINLLPAEFRKEKATGSFLRNKLFLNGLTATFLILTFFLHLQYRWVQDEYKRLKEQWSGLEKDSVRMAQLKTQIEQGVKDESDFLHNYVSSPFSTTAILNAVNALLPSSIWLLELKVTRLGKDNTFLLKGISLPGKQGMSIQDIEKYLSDLKEKFPTRTEIVLTTSRQVKDNRELTLFTAVFKWL